MRAGKDEKVNEEGEKCRGKIIKWETRGSRKRGGRERGEVRGGERASERASERVRLLTVESRDVTERAPQWLGSPMMLEAACGEEGGPETRRALAMLVVVLALLSLCLCNSFVELQFVVVVASAGGGRCCGGKAWRWQRPLRGLALPTCAPGRLSSRSPYTLRTNRSPPLL